MAAAEGLQKYKALALEAALWERLMSEPLLADDQSAVADRVREEVREIAATQIRRIFEPPAPPASPPTNIPEEWLRQLEALVERFSLTNRDPLPPRARPRRLPRPQRPEPQAPPERHLPSARSETCLRCNQPGEDGAECEDGLPCDFYDEEQLEATSKRISSPVIASDKDSIAAGNRLLSERTKQLATEGSSVLPAAEMSLSNGMGTRW